MTSHFQPDEPLEGPVEIQFESVTQDARLKPSEIYRYGDSLNTVWWRNAIGKTHSDYYKETFVGAVLTHLVVTLDEGRVLPQDQATLRFQTRLGRLPGPNGKTPRYGGIDRIEIINPRGTRAGSVESVWYWFKGAPGEKPGTMEAPPPLFPPCDRMLEAGPPPPALHPVDQPAVANRFTWTDRETDLNRHVNSVAFVERIENALADADPEGPRPKAFELWYHKPGFRGQRMETCLSPREGGTLVLIRGADAGVLSVTARVQY